MAISLGFGQGNKNTPMSGSTGGGSVQPKLQLKMNPDGSLGTTTDGSGGFLNYLKGLATPAATPAATGALGGAAGAAAPAATGAAGAAGAAGW